MIDRIGNHCNVVSGYAFKATDLLAEADVPVIKIGNISNCEDVIVDDNTQYVVSDYMSLNEKYHVKKGDILISLTGSHINQPNSMVGRICRNYSDKEFLLNQRAGKIIVKDNSDKDYIYYMFMLGVIKESIVTRAYGAANQVNISPSAIESIKWNFPELKVQKQIGGILSAYDQLIYNNNKRIKILEQMAEILYKEWFVRFRFPGYEDTEFENGIPKGWRIKKLGKICNVFTGKCNREDAEIDGKYPLFDRSQEIKRSNVWLKDCQAIIVPGEGTSFIPRYYEGKFNLHQRCYCVEPNQRYMGMYIYHTLMENRSYFLSVATGATVPSLRLNNFYSMKLLLPNEKICREYDELAMNIYHIKEMYERKNENLATQRNLLLPRLMSGKLQVK